MVEHIVLFWWMKDANRARDTVSARPDHRRVPTSV